MIFKQRSFSTVTLTLVIIVLMSANALGQSFSKPFVPVSLANPNLAPAEVTVSTPVTVAAGMREATVAVIPPNKFPRCPDGRLLFGSGALVRSISLTPATGAAPFTHDFFAAAQSPKDISPPLVIYDNHLVASGDNLIFTFEAIIWRDNITHPSWWNDTETNTLKSRNKPGGRAAIFVFKSNTCGETWGPASVIDAAQLEVLNPNTQKKEVGYCGYPRVNTTNHTAEAGGWDGHYLYQDFMPANFELLTTICVTGKGPALGLVLSAQAANSWTVLRQYENPDTFWRIPAAMLSNQTVAIAYKQGGNVVLEAARFPFTLHDFKTIAKYPTSFPPITTASVGLSAAMYGYFSLVNTTIADKGPLTANVPNKTKEGFQVAVYTNNNNTVAYNLYFQTPDSSSAVPKPFATIKAATPGNNVLQGTLVQSAVPGRSSIFYWIEQLSQGNFKVRCQPFSQNVALGAPKAISGTFGTPSFTGDYLGATSYLAKDGTHYFLSWSESDTNALKYVEVFVPIALSL